MSRWKWFFDYIKKYMREQAEIAAASATLSESPNDEVHRRRFVQVAGGKKPLAN